MKKFALLACLLAVGCSKYGPSGCAEHAMGNWVETNLPPGCHVKQISAEESAGVAVLCEDGRVFH